MESNTNDFGTTSGAGSVGSSTNYGTGNDVGGNFGTTAGSTASTGSVGDAVAKDAANLKDRAKDMAGTAKEKLADVGSQVREQAGTAKNKLADALETGADKLRQRQGGASATGGDALAGATTGGNVVVADGRTAQVTEKVAGGMQATADWLREADLDSMRDGIEHQVKEHPGRTLLIAAGLGYLLGKAFRR